MTSIVFYFQVHQPYRLRQYSYLEVGEAEDYFDDPLNQFVVERVAERCYLPMNAVLKKVIEQTDGRFRCSFSISGTALTQMEAWAPEALASFQDLAQTGYVEFLGETSHHSLAALADPSEFKRQVAEHARRIESLFGRAPRIFRNTELIVDDAIAKLVEDAGFDAIMAEGAEPILGDLSPNAVYRAASTERLKLLLRSYHYSDDIAFRFSNKEWAGYPLMADTFATWFEEVPEHQPFIGLFMDYETFGEHQAADTGIFDFMEYLPGYLLDNPRFRFETPSEFCAQAEPVARLDIPRPVSWADAERDTSAWLGNHMQRAAHEALYALGPKVRQLLVAGEPRWLDTWRKLTTSDHVYYMSTKWDSDGDVHEYFSPYPTPHDAFIIFMNVLEDFTGRMDRALEDLGLSEKAKTTPRRTPS